MDEELFAEFLTESNENLASIEEQLLDLEADPENADILDGIFRVIHTVKGSCGFLGLGKLEKVAHAGENLLSKIRTLKHPVDADLVSLLLEMVDAIKVLLEKLEETGVEPDVDHTALCARLQAAERLIASLAEAAASDIVTDVATDAPASVEQTDPLDWVEGYSKAIVKALSDAGLFTAEKVVEAGFETLKGLPGFKPASALKILGLASSLTADQESSSPNDDVAEGTPSPAAVESTQSPQAVAASATSLPVAANKPVAEAEKTAVTAKRKPASEGSIRVDVDILDGLMNLVGELVLSRNRLMSLVQIEGDVELVRTSRGIGQVTSQLQEQLLHTRMQPISTLWGTVPRLLRDITKQLNKKITVEMEGQETELDRTILAALKDPLTHIIRNSCDHGIEEPQARLKKGKSAEGTIHLTANQESGFIVINIRDDGNGIDPVRIRDKALSMNVISEEQARTMTEKSLLQLIFHAGLSTAEKVSNVSGRGVGMDVVRSEIEKVGGTVEIDSTMGEGTTLNIRIPLTLAIIPAMIVSCHDQRFAIPQSLVQELIAVDEEENHWESVAGEPFYRLRDNLLPILGLSKALELEGASDTVKAIVVVNIAQKEFGLGVDSVLGAEEIVVKQLGRHMQYLDVYGGCSILGDGQVVPILDCNGLGKMIDLGQENDSTHTSQEREDQVFTKESQHILIFGHAGHRYAIPMLLIERLEDLPAERIETAGAKEVLQYRGKVIPVLRWGGKQEEKKSLKKSVKEDAEKSDVLSADRVKCLIISDNGRQICLQVEKIIDVVREELEIKLPSNDPHYLGTALLQGQSTEVVDVFEILKLVDPNWFTSVKSRPEDQAKKILFVEDTVFFRNMIVPVLEGLGYTVWTANDGAEAIKILERETPDLVLTDLEMPHMDGFELARWIMNQPRLKGLPIVALSSLPPEEYNKRAVGIEFSDQLVKFDRATLTEHLSGIFSHAKNEEIIHIEAEPVTQDNKVGGVAS